jgi:hypothetical protein
MKKKTRNMTLRTLIFVAVISLAISGSAIAAVGHPSAKATCKIADITLIDTTTDLGWTTLLSNTIKTANKKDLFIDVSLECGLYTDTKVDSLGGIEDRAKAEAAVQVRVLVDGVEALPGVINFARRSQILIAEFQGLLTDEDGNVCLSVDPLDPNLIIIDEDCLRPETLELILDTMTANSFNFIFPDVTSGVRLIEVQAKINTWTESTLDSGAKVKDSGDGSDDFIIGDDTLTVDKEGKFEVGQEIVIDDENFIVDAISGKDLTLNHAAAADHSDRTRIYIVAGAEANATIGKGSVTVEEVRLIKDEDIVLE